MRILNSGSVNIDHVCRADHGAGKGETIVVIGSLNMDFVVQVEKLPMPGETLCGERFQMIPGGKGANQACAVGRLNGNGKMVGRVGEDVSGEQLLKSLQSAGVDTSKVLKTSNAATGVALIFVQKGGQNQIVIAPGANGQLTPQDVQAADGTFKGGYLLMQLESPQETVEMAASIGRARGMTTILDPTPVRPLSSGLLKNIDIITPNETEALRLLGRSASGVSLDEAPQIAQRLRELGPKTVILKMGEKGAWLVNDQFNRHFPAFKVEAVDATAAGDTFNGALAVALADGKPMDEAINFANCAAAISVTRLGAQASIPTRQEVDAMLRSGKVTASCGKISSAMPPISN
jgi:ribokinase